jgi:hypothetical protein
VLQISACLNFDASKVSHRTLPVRGGWESIEKRNTLRSNVNLGDITLSGPPLYRTTQSLHVNPFSWVRGSVRPGAKSKFSSQEEYTGRIGIVVSVAVMSFASTHSGSAARQSEVVVGTLNDTPRAEPYDMAADAVCHAIGSISGPEFAAEIA